MLAKLVRELREDFYGFYMDCKAKRPSRDAEMMRLRELRDAANLLAFVDPLLIPFDQLGEAEEEQFLATAKRLANFWTAELAKLEAAPSAAGRRSHDAFHELIIGLISTYQRVTRKRALIPSTRFNKSGYHGGFYHFAIAAWCCLRDHLPEAAHLMPYSEDALAEALRKHWPKKGTAAHKLIQYPRARGV